jgi:hypothetical protein
MQGAEKGAVAMGKGGHPQAELPDSHRRLAERLGVDWSGLKTQRERQWP